MLKDFTHDIFGKEISFDGNPNLKRPGIQLAYTKEHVEEFIKCANDWKYFAEHYYHILDLQKGMIIPKIRDYQEKMIESYINNRFNIVLASRQCVTGDTIIKVKNIESNEIFEISIQEFEKLLEEIKLKPISVRCFKCQENNKYKIFTNNGWEDFSGLGKTNYLDIIEIETNEGLILKGSCDHRIFDEDLNEIKLNNVKLNNVIFTATGPQKIVKIIKHSKKQQLYDILDVTNSKYFTNNILSHNCGKSTGFEIFLCWIILFQKDQRVGILANKAEQARDILRKVKQAYEMLPKWLQQGVKVWNSGSIQLENGSIVIAASTSSTAIRGRSINCITGKNKIKVKDKETNEIKEITLDELYKDFK